MQYKCKYCTNTFSSSKQVREHQMLCSNLGPYYYNSTDTRGKQSATSSQDDEFPPASHSSLSPSSYAILEHRTIGSGRYIFHTIRIDGSEESWRPLDHFVRLQPGSRKLDAVDPALVEYLTSFLHFDEQSALEHIEYVCNLPREDEVLGVIAKVIS